MHPSQPPQKQEISLETARVPAIEINLIRESFKGGQLTDSKVLSTDIIYTSVTKKRETITQEAISQGNASLEQGHTITARTNRRGFPVATISPQIRATPFLGLIDLDRDELQTKASPKQNSIFSSLTAPTISKALASALKDLITESPAEKAKREQQERLTIEAQRQELQRLQQAAQAERAELTNKTSQNNHQTSQQTKAEISAISGMASSENEETLRSAIALSQSIDSRIASETTLTSEINPEMLQSSLNPDTQTPINEERQSRNTLAHIFSGIKDSAIEELRISYSERGAEGKFMSSVLEALTNEASSLQTLTESQFIMSSAPAIFEGVIADLIQQTQTTSSVDEGTYTNLIGIENSYNAPLINSFNSSESMESAPIATTFSSYLEKGTLGDTLAGFSFSEDLRARALAELA